MSSQSPANVLYSSDGYELAVVSGDPFIAGTRSILFAGNDGTNTRTVLIDASGRQVIVGAGTAGAQAGGVVTIQGDPSGTAVPVSGTVAVTQSTSPWVVSGTVTANAGTGTFNIAGTVNQGTPNTLANAWPITLTDGYGNIQGSAVNPLYVTGSITATNPSVGTDGATALGFDTQVGGKVTTAAPTYTTGNLDALSLTTLGGLRIDGVYATGTANATAADAMVSGGYVTTAAPTYTTGQLQPLSLDTSGNLRVSGFVTTNKASTSAVTSVAQSTSNTVLLAANANRVFASVYNNTGQKMYIKLGTTASTTSYSIQLMPNSYWEVPNDWTGEIDAVWSGNGSNSALVTELTP